MEAITNKFFVRYYGYPYVTSFILFLYELLLTKLLKGGKIREGLGVHVLVIF